MILNSLRNNRSNYIKWIFYLLLFLNLGVGNIEKGYLYFYTSTTNIVGVLSIFIMLVGLLGLLKGQMMVEKKLFILQMFYIMATMIALLINGKNIITIFASIYISIIPLVIGLLSISYTSKQNGYKFIKKFVVIYSLWLSLQTLILVVNQYFLYGSVNKSTIKVSIGGSNFIAAHLIVCLVFLVFSGSEYIGKKYRFAVMLSLLATILTISFGAIFTLFIVGLLVLLFDKRFRKLKYRLLFSVVLVLIIVVLFSLESGWIFNVINETSIFYQPLLKFTQKFNYIFSGNYTRALSGRDFIYNLALQEFYKKPIFGYGEHLYYSGEIIRTHNWVLDTLIFRGLFGSAFYLMMVMYILFKIFNHKNNNKTLVAIKYALITGIIHGMIEPNFFTRTFDYLWWLLASVAIGEILKKSRLDRNVGGK